MQPPVALTIAGSDSGGGAGIQADLRTFAAFEIHGTSAITAVTAQNTLGVQHVYALSTQAVVEQVESVVSDFSVSSVKTGMLANPDIVAAVGQLAAAGKLPHLIVDPVVVATSGDLLLGPGGIEAYRSQLLPHAQLATPNLQEACALAGFNTGDIRTIDEVVAVAYAILAMGPAHVLVKGGHFFGARGQSPDVLVGSSEVIVLDAPRIETTNDHGTGCSLSAAIVAGLANGRDLENSVSEAKAFVTSGLQSAAKWKLGHGRGPIDHFGWDS